MKSPSYTEAKPPLVSLTVYTSINKNDKNKIENNLAAMIFIRNHWERESLEVILLIFETQHFNGGHKKNVLGKTNDYEPQHSRVYNELVKTKLKQAILEITPYFHMLSFHPIYSLTIALHSLLAKHCAHYVWTFAFTEYHKVFLPYATSDLYTLFMIRKRPLTSDFHHRGRT